MQSVSPVFTEAEISSEKVVALEQLEYLPIIVLRVRYMDRDEENTTSVATVTRFRFSEKERAAIASGADLLISQPHHGALMPLGFQFAFEGQYPLTET